MAGLALYPFARSGFLPSSDNLFLLPGHGQVSQMLPAVLTALGLLSPGSAYLQHTHELNFDLYGSSD